MAKANKSTSTGYVRCYENHKPIELAKGILHGGNCGHPVDGCDVYIGLDRYSMKAHQLPYPWEPQDSNLIAFLYPITDGSAPKDTKEFTKLCEWIAEQLEGAKEVHVGCIGGHGRTGMVLAAVRKIITGDKDSAIWIRENYCKKAIETQTQVDMLEKVFGLSRVEPSKGHSTTSKYDTYLKHTYGASKKSVYKSTGERIWHAPTNGNIWGK